MESHVMKKDTSSFDEKELQQIVIPLKQMIREDDDEEDNCIGETVTCLTGRVRACYLKHLEKTLMKNYEICCEKGSAQWHLSPEDVVRCAVRMEQKALRSCMVVILYQRAMTRLASDIKKHTEQLKLYRKLKDYVTTHSVWSDKTTQTAEHFDCVDKMTQTVFPGTIEAAVESCNFQTETKTDTSKSSPADQCLQPLAVKTELPTPEAVHKEFIQGAPIPVYVSGISDTGNGHADYYYVNGIEPLPYHDVNQQFVADVNTDNLCQYSIVSNETSFLVSHDGGITKTLTLEQDIQQEEPYEWSVIEEQSRSNVQVNAASPETLVNVRRLSNFQQNGNLSDGMLCDDEVSDLDQEEHPYMSIDDRIASVLKNAAHHFPCGETITQKDTEPSMWTVEKYHQQKLLRAKLLDTCCDVRKRGRMRLRFLELFGSDSEDGFDVDECVTYFKEKIARWVVESLMPYYREGRIQSRPLFKFLARHIADTLLLKNHMPDEADVEQCVMDFFSHHEVIQSEDDVCL